MKRPIKLGILILTSLIILCHPAYALMYFAPDYKPGLIFVDRSDSLYNDGDFSVFSWADSQHTNAGPGAEPPSMCSTMLGAPDDLTLIPDPDTSYILGRGGRVNLGFGNLFTADGITNLLPTGKHWRSVSEILAGIEVAIFQDDYFVGGSIFGKELELPPTVLARFNDDILDGEGFSPYDVAILLDLDQIDAAEGKLFSRLGIKDGRGSCPYFELDAAGVKVIPEPTSMLLLGIGLIGLAGRRIKKRFTT